MSMKIKPSELRKGDVVRVSHAIAIGEPYPAQAHSGETVVSLEDGTRYMIPLNAELALEHRDAPDLSKEPKGAVIKVTVAPGKAVTWMKTHNSWGDSIWINQDGRSRTESAFAHEQLRHQAWQVAL